MPLRPPAGFISAFFDPLNNPNAPTIGTATAGNESASVTFTAPTNVGGSAISSYSALSTPGGFVGTAASSPISVTGLTNGTAYTFAVWATNTYGPSAFSAASGSVTPSAPIGVFGGGDAGSGSNVIQQISIATTGNATSFGQLTARRGKLAAFSSSTRGVWSGGYSNLAGPGEVIHNVIDYVTISSAGNATDFGDMYTGGLYILVGASSSTRGLIAGGRSSGADTNVIQYVTIASTGNSTDFGDLNQTQQTFIGGVSSTTRAVFAGGIVTVSRSNIMDYVTIATTGNATDFGDLALPGAGGAGCSNSTRGLFAYGDIAVTGKINTISYITIASTGNSTDFGDRTTAQEYIGACASSTRGVFAGGGTNIIDYVTIDTTGNATDFGDLVTGMEGIAGCSNGHGGL